MASPYRRILPSPGLSEGDIYNRIGEAYNIAFPSSICHGGLWDWISALAEAHDTLPQYLFCSLLPTVGALVGPETHLRISQRYSEKLNVYMCILGESGSGKSSAFQLATRPLYQERLQDMLLKSSWTRNGLLAHLEANKGRCLIAYEEMDAFFASVTRGQKDGNADRSFYCELYDGAPVQVVRASNDGKKLKRSLDAIAVSIGGFHQPQPFLRENFDLHQRRDGFLERFLLACPCPKRMLPEELEIANGKLDGYITVLQSLRSLYTSIFEFHQENKSYRLSEDANQIYVAEQTEQAEHFNAIMEQRKTGASTFEDLSSKKIRIFLKLSGILHILEHAFQSLSRGTTVSIPEGISGDTAKMALALIEYFNAQKEVLLKSSQTAEEFAPPSAIQTLEERVLYHPGVFVTPRNCLKAISTSKRPKTEVMVNTMKNLEERDFGRIIHVGRSTCFAKKYPIDNSKLREINVSLAMYEESIKKIDKHLSSHQLQMFQDAYPEYESLCICLSEYLASDYLNCSSNSSTSQE